MIMEEIKILGKVKDAKILVATRDRKTKRISPLNGLVIEFETDKTISDSTVVYLVYDGKFEPFNVKEIEISGDKLIGRAVETGYWAHFLSRNKDLDLRKIIGCDVELVDNAEQLKNIYEQSLWC